MVHVYDYQYTFFHKPIQMKALHQNEQKCCSYRGINSLHKPNPQPQPAHENKEPTTFREVRRCLLFKKIYHGMQLYACKVKSWQERELKKVLASNANDSKYQSECINAKIKKQKDIASIPVHASMFSTISYEGDDTLYYKCSQCAYHSNRKYHTLMHVRRIHLLNGNGAPKKRKYKTNSCSAIMLDTASVNPATTDRYAPVKQNARVELEDKTTAGDFDHLPIFTGEEYMTTPPSNLNECYPRSFWDENGLATIPYWSEQQNGQDSFGGHTPETVYALDPSSTPAMEEEEPMESPPDMNMCVQLVFSGRNDGPKLTRGYRNIMDMGDGDVIKNRFGGGIFMKVVPKIWN